MARPSLCSRRMVGWARSFEQRCGRVGVMGFMAAAVLVPRWTVAGVFAMAEPDVPVLLPHARRLTHRPLPFHSTQVDAVRVREAFESWVRPQAPTPLAEANVPAGGEPVICPGVRVVAIAFCDDPSWSFAALMPAAPDAPSGSHSILRRAGGAVEGRRVERVDRDRVWLGGADGPCEALLSPPPPAAPLAVDRHAAAPPVAGVSRPTPGGEIEIDRSLVERFASDPAQLAKLGALRPDVDAKGNVLGLRVTGIKAGGLAAALGLHDGDRFQTINGYGMADPSEMLTAYAHLYSADMLHLEIVRDGKPMSLDYRIK